MQPIQPFTEGQGKNFALSKCNTLPKWRTLLSKYLNLPASTNIVPPFYADNFNIEIGENCFINAGCTFMDEGGIKIGNNVGISANCTFIAVDHPGNPLLLDKWVDIPKPIVVENDVWIGANAVIMPGVTIGKGAIIGAGAIVTKDIPPYAVAVGQPARVVKWVDEYIQQHRDILSPEEIAKYQNIRS